MTPDQIIYNTALSNGIPNALALLIVAQSKHETGGYTSRAFTLYKNAFGYAYVPGASLQVGPGLVADNGQPVAAYAQVADSAQEMINWIFRRLKEKRFPDLNTITTADTYAALLKQCGYYGDSLQNYSAGVARWFTDNVSLASVGGGVLILAGAALFLYLYKGGF